MNCVLCLNQNLTTIQVGEINYFNCANCDLIFLDPKHRLSAEDEKKRYELHENNVLDLGYQNFVGELCATVQANQLPNAKGLDYGSGKSSAVSYLLKQDSYQIQSYDPFFEPDSAQLTPQSFDYVILCEVAEHFFHPRIEFEKLKSYLKPQGFLFILTALKTDQIDFDTWSYRRDPTHVCFYSEKTFQWIKEDLGFKVLKIEKPNLIVLQKKD